MQAKPTANEQWSPCDNGLSKDCSTCFHISKVEVCQEILRNPGMQPLHDIELKARRYKTRIKMGSNENKRHVLTCGGVAPLDTGAAR